MNYSCCYVITDNKDLQYFNQMMISISSLRYTGFKSPVYVVTDNETAHLLSTRFNELKDLSVEIVVVEIENGFTEKEKSRYLKTSLRKRIRGDALYVDTDTVFVSCPPEWISDNDIAMAYDRNGLDEKKSYYWHKVWFSQCGLDLQEDDRAFLNSGVIWMRDTEVVYGLFDQWHSLWEKIVNDYKMPNDQVSLNYLWKHGVITVHRLENRFNVQIAQRYFSPSALSKAILIHYYNIIGTDPIFSLRDASVQKLDYRDERIQQIIHDPLSAVSDCRWIKKDNVTDEYLDTQSFQLGLAVFRKHRKIFSIFEAFSKLLFKIRSIIPKKVITEACR